VQDSETETTFDTSNASVVSGLVDYMSTLVSGVATVSDKPPPLPPKVHRAASVDRALAGQPAKQVCSVVP